MSESRAAAEALTDAKVELQRFGDWLNELQGVDLSVAVVGALITRLHTESLRVVTPDGCFRTTSRMHLYA